VTPGDRGWWLYQSVGQKWQEGVDSLMLRRENRGTSAGALLGYQEGTALITA
jgi:hypothetical protein